MEADDRNGGTATIDVTIHVADVDEPPEAPVRPGVQPASSTSLTVTWDGSCQHRSRYRRLRRAISDR